MRNRFVRLDWASLGHSHYGVSSNGWTWSHSNAAVNCQAKGLAYGAGDTLDVAFNRNDLVITKNGKDRFEFEVDK